MVGDVLRVRDFGGVPSGCSEHGKLDIVRGFGRINPQHMPDQAHRRHDCVSAITVPAIQSRSSGDFITKELKKRQNG
jgi:hypothetical protein